MLKYETVDEYIANANPKAQPILKELRELFETAVPGIEESISYGVPFYKYRGEFGGFAVYKEHVSVGYGAGVLSTADAEALKQKGYKLGKGTMQIKFDQKVPIAELNKILKAKVEINLNL